MSQPNAITIKLEISIPTGVGVPAVVVNTAQATDRFRDVVQWCPAADARHPVRPTGSGSGSGSASGCICARVQLATAVPSGRDVLAQVVQVDPTTLGSTPNLAVTTVGTTDSHRTVWNWSGARELPGALHSTLLPGVENYLVIWEPDGSTAWNRWHKRFFGYTGTSDPCGLPSGDPCMPSSGSQPAMMRMTQAAPATYPAVWLVAVAGFAGPFALFNACWALREVRRALTPTWDNCGDGAASPGVRLQLCPKNGWELALRFGGAEKAWSVPFAGNCFGPLAFLAGAAGQPTILVSAV